MLPYIVRAYRSNLKILWDIRTAPIRIYQPEGRPIKLLRTLHSCQFAENVAIFDYTAEYVNKVLFSAEPIGLITAAEEWTGERLEWTPENKNTRKKLIKNQGYEFLQGSGTARGRLIGGCIEVLEMAKGTSLWPAAEAFDDAILFFETSEDMPEPSYVGYWLRNYGSQGILQRAKALLLVSPTRRYYESIRPL